MEEGVTKGGKSMLSFSFVILKSQLGLGASYFGNIIPKPLILMQST
jgi:hypothetical protein